MNHNLFLLGHFATGQDNGLFVHLRKPQGRQVYPVIAKPITDEELNGLICAMGDADEEARLSVHGFFFDEGYFEIYLDQLSEGGIRAVDNAVTVMGMTIANSLGRVISTKELVRDYEFIMNQNLKGEEVP